MYIGFPPSIEGQRTPFLVHLRFKGLHFHSVQKFYRTGDSRNSHVRVQAQCFLLCTWSGGSRDEGIQVLLTIQNCSEVFHVSQIVGTDLPVGTKGIQHFLTKACIDSRVLGEHGHRERRQASGLGSCSVQLLYVATMNVPCRGRPAGC